MRKKSGPSFSHISSLSTAAFGRFVERSLIALPLVGSAARATGHGDRRFEGLSTLGDSDRWTVATVLYTSGKVQYTALHVARRCCDRYSMNVLLE